MFFIGDVHGNYGRYYWIVSHMIPKESSTLQVGDMGIFKERDIVNSVTGNKPHRNKSLSPDKHKFFRGNHDNPELCRKHPNYIGDYGFNPNLNMFWISGGYSIDKESRIAGISWWDEEEISWTKMMDVIELYAESKPRIVVSHECPTVAKAFTLAAGSRYNHPDKKIYCSRTENALQAMFEAHRPEIWIYGHYHTKLDEEESGTRFVCLGDNRALSMRDQVFEIPNLHW